jgi:hypothetical protein
MERFVRAILLVILVSAPAVTGQASYLGPAPIVQGVSPWVVNAGAVVTISGQNLSNSLGGCTDPFNNAPAVYFHGLSDGQDHLGQLQGTDPGNCTNMTLRVSVPGGFSGGAKVFVVDASNQRSNDNLEITLQPSASLTPGSGQVGTTVTIVPQGSANFRPPTLAPNAALTLTLNNSPRSASAWTNSSIPFDPKNASGPVQFSFPVSTDASNLGANPQTVTVNAGNYQFLPPTTSTTVRTGRASAGARARLASPSPLERRTAPPR